MQPRNSSYAHIKETYARTKDDKCIGYTEVYISVRAWSLKTNFYIARMKDGLKQGQTVVAFFIIILESW